MNKLKLHFVNNNDTRVKVLRLFFFLTLHFLELESEVGSINPQFYSKIFQTVDCCCIILPLLSTKCVIL